MIRIIPNTLLVFCLLLIPRLVIGQSSPVSKPGGQSSPVRPPSGESSSGSTFLQNPLGNKTLLGFFQDLLDAVMVLVVPVIVFFIILAGFKYVTARGNASKVEEGHKALLYAILGGVLVLGAKALLAVIQGTVESFGS